MKLAPLQLEAYFVTDLNCQANPQFKSETETKFREKDLDVATMVNPIKDKPRRWQVTLNIKLQPAEETNSPYSLCLNLVGIVWVAPELPDERLEAVLRTNGPSMLYGVAREMARDLTGRGPFPPLVLPSVSFIQDPPAASAPKSDTVAGGKPGSETGAATTEKK